MMKVWADHSLGTLGRTGDYLNSCLMALSEAGSWFAQADPAFAENVRRYYELVREQDLLTTHTLITPQANRSQDAAQQLGGSLTARIVREDDNGVVIRGARMLATIGPIADELLVMPSTVLKGAPEDAPYSFAFAIPCDTPGLRFICRESFDYGAATSTTRSARASRRWTPSSSSTTCTSRSSAASCSATPSSATASTPRPRPRCT